jgi:predicted dehydrogenase
MTAASYARAAGANERVRAAVIGLGSQGKVHVAGWKSQPHATLAGVCDIDSGRLRDVAKTDATLKAEGDLRRILDDKSIDAVSIATPDHWHAPAALLALSAGKHVYVEKPCAHNFREGQALVEGAKKAGLLVQHGTQSRSNPFIMAAIQLLREGIIGDVLAAKAWDVQRRDNIGHATPSEPPPGVDYDTWLGPAPAVPFQANRFHYNWHWWYDFGTGDMGNDGAHELDIARWGLGVDAHPTRIMSSGGKLYFDDDQQFPDTQTAVFDYQGAGTFGQRRQLTFEMRIWSTNYPHNVDTGCEFYGTRGQMMFSKRGKIQVRGEDNKPIARRLPEPATSSVADHVANFVAGIREGKPLHAPIAEGALSAALCQFGNVAARVGRTLHFDPATQRFVKDDEATGLLGRTYRTAHWSVPQGLT